MEAPFIRIKAIALMVSSLTLTYLNFKQWSAYDNGLLHATQELNLKNKILLNLRVQTDRDMVLSFFVSTFMSWIFLKSRTIHANSQLIIFGSGEPIEN